MLAPTLTPLRLLKAGFTQGNDMQLSKADVVKLQEIYRQVLGQEISYADALHEGTRILGLVKAVVQASKRQ